MLNAFCFHGQFLVHSISCLFVCLDSVFFDQAKLLHARSRLPAPIVSVKHSAGYMWREYNFLQAFDDIIELIKCGKSGGSVNRATPIVNWMSVDHACPSGQLNQSPQPAAGLADCDCERGTSDVLRIYHVNFSACKRCPCALIS